MVDKLDRAEEHEQDGGREHVAHVDDGGEAVVVVEEADRLAERAALAVGEGGVARAGVVGTVERVPARGREEGTYARGEESAEEGRGGAVVRCA